MSKILKSFTEKFAKCSDTRPYKNAAVRFKKFHADAFDERFFCLEKAGLNVFKFPADRVSGCDLLSDSGTTTMTMEQWSRLILGDEAYGSNEGYYEMKEQIAETFGPDWTSTNRNLENMFLFHQGRACEHALFTILKKMLPAKNPIKGEPFYIIPSNGHFDTTEANVADNAFRPLNLFSKELMARDVKTRFKGNMNTDKLEALLAEQVERVPLVYLTITNNTGGGQPVSLENIKKVRAITKKYKVPMFIDACRFAENAWFIQQHEKAYQKWEVSKIVHEIFKNADGFHISLKKDGLANMGGAIVLKENTAFTNRYPEFQNRLTDHQILIEGHPTYGGLSGRDIKTIIEGLRTVTRQDYLDHRIRQVERFGKKLLEYKIPLIEPFGGHGVFIDMDKFFAGVPKADEDFKGISFTALLLLAGHRLCELGIFAFGKNVKGKEIPPEPRVNFVRAAVPRLAYEDQDLFALAEVISVLYKHRGEIPGVEVTFGKDLSLRHFKSNFKFKK